MSGRPPLPGLPGQRERLQRLTEKIRGWGVVVYMEPPGDVACLVSILPELRGYEIVSASPASGGRDYDIWKNGLPFRFNMTMGDVETFLRKFTKTDAELLENAAAWTEATFKHYGIKPKRGAGDAPEK
jgi:hypothetical protein